MQLGCVIERIGVEQRFAAQIVAGSVARSGPVDVRACRNNWPCTSAPLCCAAVVGVTDRAETGGGVTALAGDRDLSMLRKDV